MCRGPERGCPGEASIDEQIRLAGALPGGHPSVLKQVLQGSAVGRPGGLKAPLRARSNADPSCRVTQTRPQPSAKTTLELDRATEGFNLPAG